MRKLEKIELIASRLLNAKNVAVLTGAGVSAESGIKTFRDPDGLWAKFNPQELASMEGFMSNPRLVLEWYNHRREIINRAEPNAGHFALAKMEEIFPQFTLITQNVDRLHQRAGSHNVQELHGNIIENHCVDCKKNFMDEIAGFGDELPVCSYCGGLLRPSVVWFGEMLPEDALSNADIAARTCSVFFSIGTSGDVYPAAGLPLLAKDSGALTVEINPRETSLTPYLDISLRMNSAIALPKIIDKMRELKQKMLTENLPGTLN